MCATWWIKCSSSPWAYSFPQTSQRFTLFYIFLGRLCLRRAKSEPCNFSTKTHLTPHRRHTLARRAESKAWGAGSEFTVSKGDVSLQPHTLSHILVHDTFLLLPTGKKILNNWPAGWLQLLLPFSKYSRMTYSLARLTPFYSLQLHGALSRGLQSSDFAGYRYFQVTHTALRTWVL